MFDEYISAHGKRLFGLCQKLCKNREDAEDLYQETWIKAYKFFEKYDGSKEFAGWLTIICVNTYRDMLRRQKWKLFFVRFATNEEKDLFFANQVAAVAPDYSEVQEAVNELPDKLRMVITLYYFNGLDTGKTAQLLKIPLGTVKYRLRQARELLKRRLEHDG